MREKEFDMSKYNSPRGQEYKLSIIQIPITFQELQKFLIYVLLYIVAILSFESLLVRICTTCVPPNCA